MFPLNLGKCNKPIVVINQQSTGTVKHLESLIQSEKFGGVASTDSKKCNACKWTLIVHSAHDKTHFAILPYRLERYGKQETRLDRSITVLVLAMQAEKTIKSRLSD